MGFAMIEFTLAQKFHLHLICLGANIDLPDYYYDYKKARQACINAQNRLTELLAPFSQFEIQTLQFQFHDGENTECIALEDIIHALDYVLDDRLSVTSSFMSVTFQALRVIYVLENNPECAGRV